MAELAELIVVTTTMATKEVANEIARKLVEAGLVACGQVSGPVTSFYKWQGALVEDVEFVLSLKSAAANYHDLEQMLKDLHPYGVPEIIVTPIVAGSPEYLAWLKAAVGSRSA